MSVYTHFLGVHVMEKCRRSRVKYFFDKYRQWAWVERCDKVEGRYDSCYILSICPAKLSKEYYIINGIIGGREISWFMFKDQWLKVYPDPPCNIWYYRIGTNKFVNGRE